MSLHTLRHDSALPAQRTDLGAASEGQGSGPRVLVHVGAGVDISWRHLFPSLILWCGNEGQKRKEVCQDTPLRTVGPPDRPVYVSPHCLHCILHLLEGCYLRDTTQGASHPGQALRSFTSAGLTQRTCFSISQENSQSPALENSILWSGKTSVHGSGKNSIPGSGKHSLSTGEHLTAHPGKHLFCP